MTYQPPLNGKRISIKADANPAIESGEVTLASGSNVTLDQTGSTITIESATDVLGGDIEAVGTVKMYAGSSAPTGWMVCDGTAVSRATYADLFAVIGETYGNGDGSTTFNLPNLKGRVPVGHDSGQTEFDALGETGGEKEHQLTVGEMPSHTHIQDPHTHLQNSHNHTQNSHTHTGPSHTHSGSSLTISETDTIDDVFSTYTRIDVSRGSGTSAESSSAAFSVGTGTMQHGVRATGDRLGSGSGSAARIRFITRHDHTVSGSTGSGGTGSTSSTTATNNSTTATNQNTTATNQDAGGDGAHNNLQPYVVMNYIIKVTSAAVGEGESLPVSSVETQTSDYSMDLEDAIVLADANSNNVTITLPLASGASGRTFYVKRIDSSGTYTVTITCSGSDTVDGEASVTIPDQWAVMGLVSNGSNWFIL